MLPSRPNNRDNPYRPMVGWYDFQLLRTGLQTAQQALLRQTDMRVLRGTPAASIHDCAAPAGLWFDYVSDVGDGWLSTFSVASQLAKDTLPALGEAVPRGELLLFGGDLVYPSPTPDDYQQRLVQPYTIAFQQARASKEGPPRRQDAPRLFAIPGNHDWYDGLFEFTQLFCSGEGFGGFSTHQTHSYFALRLPRGWYLFGLDTGLDDDLDAAQLRYFKRITDQLVSERAADQSAPRVILCLAIPHWTYTHLYGLRVKPRLAELMKYLGARGIEVPLQLSGDLHHYQRYLDASQTQLALTAGGGGAFLHPTNTKPCGPRPAPQEASAQVTRRRAPPAEALSGAGAAPAPPAPPSLYDIALPVFAPNVESDFPSREESQRLAGFWPMLRALFLKNRRLFLIMGVLYSLWSIPMPPVPHNQPLLESIVDATAALAVSPWRAIWIGCLILSGFFFTDTHSTPFRYLASAAHMGGHLLGALVANWLTMTIWGLVPVAPHGAWCDIVLFFANIVPGGLLGASIFMLYLYVSFAWFGRHGNEVFSWLQVEDFKNFLRLHIDSEGALSVYAFRVRITPHPHAKPRRAPDDPAKPPQADVVTELHEKMSFRDGRWSVVRP